jgi:glutamyl/glutaminyl-tRNA synthetase
MTNENKKVVVRMAPSPTGNLHVGTARTALSNFLFAKKLEGKYILRIEDTDKERSTKEFEKNIIDGLAWLGLSYDELYRQSERTGTYVSHLKKMLENGSVYLSQEEAKEEGQRSEVLRFKNPNKKIVFEDLIRGTVEFDTTELGDFVVAKSLEEPLYHLAVVVDDHEMGVTHIIRGEDHISNTPRQILIQEAIGATRPVYAHLPLLLGADKSKLSKRKHGAAVWVDTYKNQGVLPDALLNYLALLGWNPGTEKEIFSLAELIETYDLTRVHKGGAIFDEKKLQWINRKHIDLLSPEEKLKMIAKEFDTTIEPTLDLQKISWKETPAAETITHLEKALTLLSDKDSLMAYAESVGKGNVLWPLRYALSGQEKSPDPFTLIALLGVEKSKKRIDKALALLK